DVGWLRLRAGHGARKLSGARAGSRAREDGRWAADLADLVAAVDEYADPLEAAALGVAQLHVAADDHEVVRLDQVRGGAVDADFARAALTLDHVGGQPRAVGDVEHVDLLVGQEVGRLDQVGVDRDAALVLHVRLGHGGAVNLGLEHGSYHEGVLQSDGLRSPTARCAKLADGLRSLTARCAKLADGLRSPTARCAKLASASGA